MNLNDTTNALAARIDAFEIAVGGTVTQLHIDELTAISAALKDIGSSPEVTVVAAPVAVTPAPAMCAADVPDLDEDLDAPFAAPFDPPARMPTMRPKAKAKP